MRIFAAFISALLLPQLATAQSDRAFESDTSPTTVIGPRNPDLHEGAKLLLAGDAEAGVRKTLEGLEVAVGEREHEAALSNLCAGYILLAQYQAALGYCDLLLARNDQNWPRLQQSSGRLHQAEAVRQGRTGPCQGWRHFGREHILSRWLGPCTWTPFHPVAPEVEVDDRQAPTDDEQSLQ